NGTGFYEHHDDDDDEPSWDKKMVYKARQLSQSASSDCVWTVAVLFRIIVAALLVASVASMDMDLLKFNKEKSLYKFDRPVYNEMMLKQKLGYPVEKTMIYGDNVEVPTYLQDEILNKNVVLGLEEIVMTPLFREYMTLPLFRQYWSYPMFQRFVASIYFQRFWEIPAFQQYFLSPVLFYKYVYPLVTVFKYETNTMTSTYGDLFKGDFVGNKNVLPYVYGQRDLVNTNKFFYPTIYNNNQDFQDQVYYKALLEKMYNHLYTINKPVNKFFEDKYPVETLFVSNSSSQVDTIFGDKLIKNIYGDKLFKNIFGDKLIKNLDTIYGEDKLIKNIYGDKLINNFETIYGDKLDTIYGDKLVKDALLKKMLLKKMMPELINEETYKTILPEEMLREKYTTMMPTMYKYNPLVARMMYGKRFPMINNFETEKMMLNKKDLIDQDILPLYLEKLEKERLFNDKLQFNKIFDNEIEIPKMMDVTKFERVPITQGMPTMGVRTFNKFEKFVPEIKA
ncbi:hypothetical protein Ocin01_08411, partial [Orchesella cincta]